MSRRRSAPASVPPEGPTSASAAAGAEQQQRRDRNDSPTGWPARGLSPSILLAVSVQRGCLIEECLRGANFFNNAVSTLYRALRQREADGPRHSRWEADVSRPARRVYSLTDVGRTWLNHWANGLSNYRRGLDQDFGVYAVAAAGLSHGAKQLEGALSV